MSVSRRTALAFGANAIASSMLLGPGRLAAQNLPELSGPVAVFPEGIRVPTVEEYLDTLESLTGTEHPFRQEVARSKVLLQDIPKKESPYATAYRFYQWRKGLVGANAEQKREYAYYIREWPVRGNPVIMGFFDATGLRTPDGDATYWCSAFVCWCIQRSLGVPGNGDAPWPYQNGAASSSYRNWGIDVIASGLSPQKGDLAVFRVKKSHGAGHIGFVDHVDTNFVWVLGGNQSSQDERNGGEVNISKFSRDPKSTSTLELLSFRRSPILMLH